MLNVTEIADEVRELTAWQETPMPLFEGDYVKMVKRALRQFFVDINHPTEFDSTLFITGDDGTVYYDGDFIADEIFYLTILCKIEFFQRVQTDVNNRFSYSTNAMKVSNADKPYANLKDTLGDLQHDRRIYFNKMVRYTLGT